VCDRSGTVHVCVIVVFVVCVLNRNDSRGINAVKKKVNPECDIIWICVCVRPEC